MNIPPDVGSKPRRLLLVEDDVDQAHLVKYLLEAEGTLSVTLAQDGLRAVQLLEESDWDLLITDLNLPGADGIEVMVASRRLRPDLSILATTGYTGPEYGARARERGADAVLIKPLDRDDLLHHVESLLVSRTPAPDPPTDPESRPVTAPPSVESERSVLVLSVRPGDAEAGCGGALLAHSRRGDQVVLFHFSGGSDPDRDRRIIESAGRRLGARTFITSPTDSGENARSELVHLVTSAIGELRPDILYLPTSQHPHPRHRAVSRAASAAATDVPIILAYDPGDASPSFAPGLFAPLETTGLEEKLEITSGYEPWGSHRLQPMAIRASAAFWGRYSDGALAEGFEVVRGASDLAAVLFPPPRATSGTEETA